ncbi:MAG: polysaccharide biosynthesis tyrosine autokinase [Actinomycetota bacterium]
MNPEIGPVGGNGRAEGRPYPAASSSTTEPAYEAVRGPRPSAVRDYATTLRRWRSTIAVITFLVLGLAAAYSYTRPPVYSSDASVLVKPVQTSTEPARLSDIDAQTEMKIATSYDVAQDVAQRLGVRDPRALLGHVSASMTEGSQILTITFTAKNPDEARLGAQTFAQAYLNYRAAIANDAIARLQASIVSNIGKVKEKIQQLKDDLRGAAPGSADEQTLNQDLQIQSALLVNLQSQLGSFSVTSGVPGTIIDPAGRPAAPSSPNHPFDLAAGLFVGLLLGAGVAFLREQMQQRIDSPEEVEGVLGVPALTTVPRMGRVGRRRAAGLAVDRDSTGGVAQSYRLLRTSLLAARERSAIRVVLVTSAGAGEGKTTTAANVAAALAEVGAQVVLVSADLRKPTLHQIFGVPDKPGLTEVLANGAKLARAMRKTTVKNVRLVPSGNIARSTDAANLLESPRMRAVLDELRGADWVIVDAPPVLGPPDALILSDLADAVLFVVDAHTTGERNAAAACRQIGRAGGRVIGAVINRAEGFSSYQYEYPQRSWFSSRRSPSAGPPPRRSRRGSEDPTRDEHVPADRERSTADTRERTTPGEWGTSFD